MGKNKYKKLIQNSVLELKKLFCAHPHIFLTEEDVRCVLYKILIAKIGFVKSTDGTLSSPVHSEVRWYGKQQNMRNRSDVVVLDTTDLRVTAEGFPLPSKGYGFNNFYAAIEIKLRRIGGESNTGWLNKLKKDADTLLSLRREVVNAYEPLLILIAFDRKTNIKKIVEEALPEVEVVYQSSL